MTTPDAILPVVKTDSDVHTERAPAATQACEFLRLSFSPLSVPVRTRWRNNGLSADFLGDYATTFIPVDADESDDRHKEIRHAVSYIANELLENAMKYHLRDCDVPIEVHMELSAARIAVRVSNAIGRDQAARYRAFADSLGSEDPGTLLMSRLEGGLDADESGLGLLTMMNDYNVSLDLQFRPIGADGAVQTVTTSALFALNDTALNDNTLNDNTGEIR